MSGDDGLLHVQNSGVLTQVAHEHPCALRSVPQCTVLYEHGLRAAVPDAEL